VRKCKKENYFYFSLITKFIVPPINNTYINTFTALFQKRKHSSSKPDPSDPMSRDTYKGLALHGYNALSELRWSDVEMPLELNDDQLLVKVEAASVNALDVDMLNGYGKQLFESVRPLPAVLGT
jgi:hypothetical protein